MNDPRKPADPWQVTWMSKASPESLPAVPNRVDCAYMATAYEAANTAVADGASRATIYRWAGDDGLVEYDVIYAKSWGPAEALTGPALGGEVDV